MKRYLLIIISTIIAFSSCEDVNEIDDQRTNIVSYLTTYSYSYTQFDNAYRYIVEEYEDNEAITNGSTFYMDFAAYTFTTAPSTLYYTNIESYLEDDLSGLNTEYWSFEPKEVTLGTTDLIEGLTTCLKGCHYGDSINVFICSDLAFEDKGVGIITESTAVMYAIRILEK